MPIPTEPIGSIPDTGFNAAEKSLSPANVGKLVEKWRFPAVGSKETIGVVHATPTGLFQQKGRCPE